ncbi:hypothetical protein BDV24DRAFT_173359 [Aspergillus arachidicola]|uniref:Fungal N-terminal domain-containing protein n=1 Tax=Aspergillus arachidicola TaxID=656916 RepID=A0A5N6YBU2_9EURO|nr:hypothetical protein BDV24DRAFT_173359 [Aspergillus arachidicola]
MTDPFSVGAGVIGVLSLGITVCQGLAAYYGPFTQFDNETKALVQKAEGLTSTLKQLEALLKRLWNPLSSPPDEVHLVTQRIKDCQVELEGLSHSLAKCRGCDATTAIKKSDWYYARKALYPFKRGTLISLTGTVSDLQSNLDTALLILNLYVPTHVSENAFHQPPSIQGIVQTAGRSSDPDPFRATADLSGHPEFPTSRRHQSTSTAARNAPITLHPVWACGKHQLNFLYMPTGNVPAVEREATTIFHRRYVFCNQLLGFSIQFSMNAVSGAGGFTILPSFDFRRVVPNDTPAFRLIGDFKSMLTERSSGVSPDRVLLQLQCLFEKGEASPNDILSDGTNLLRVSYCMPGDKAQEPKANEDISMRWIY